MNIIRAFLPARRYARLLAIAMCLCLPVSVTSRCSIETHGRIELLFGIEASFGRSYTVLGISIVETCSQISSRKLDAHEGDKLGRCGREVDNTCNDRLLVYNSDRQAPSTARCRRAGSLHLSLFAV